MTAERCPTCDRDWCPRMGPGQWIELDAIRNCNANRVDWRSRALAAEADAARRGDPVTARCPTCDKPRGRGRPTGAVEDDPGHCWNFAPHWRSCSWQAVDWRASSKSWEDRALSAEVDAARWRRVAPLIDDLRAASDSDDDACEAGMHEDAYRETIGAVNHALGALLAATTDRATAPEGDETP